MDLPGIISRFIVAALSFPALLSGTAMAAPRNLTPKETVYEMVRTRDMDKLDSLIAVFRNNGDSLAVAIAFNAKGKNYYALDDYSKAIDNQEYARQLGVDCKDTVFYLRNINDLATNYRRLGDYSMASEYLYDGLKMAEAYSGRDTDEGVLMRSFMLNGLGNVYKYLDNGQLAEQYFRKSLALDIERGNDLGAAKNYSTIGSIYEHREEYDSARVMYNHALEYDIKLRSRSGIGICNNRLGHLAVMQGEQVGALRHYTLAYESLKASNDKWNLLRSILSLATLYNKMSDFRSAKMMLDEAKEIIGNQRLYGYLVEYYYNEAEYYRLQGKYKEGYACLMESYNIRDTIDRQRNEQEITQAAINYERARNADELARIKYEDSQKARFRERILIFESILAFFLLVVVVNLFFLIKSQKRYNRKLSELNDTKSRLLTIVTHDLKTPVIAQRKLLSLLVDNYDYLSKDEIKTQIVEMYRSAESLKGFIVSVLDWARLSLGAFKYNPIRIDLHTVINEVLKTETNFLKSKDITLDSSVLPGTYLYTDLVMLRIVLGNLITNAVKFSSHGSKIYVYCTPAKNNFMAVTIADDGVGMEKEILEKVFTRTVDSVSGTAGEKGTGIGLLICAEMVRLCGGEIKAESKKGSGTKITFTVKSDS